MANASYPEGFNPYALLQYDTQLIYRPMVLSLDLQRDTSIYDDYEFTYYAAENAVPTLELRVDDRLPNNDALFEPCYVLFMTRVMYRPNITTTAKYPEWHNYRDCVFVSAEREWDRKRHVHTVKLLGIASLLSTVRVLDEHLKDGKRQFEGDTPGAVVSTLFAEAKERGELPQMTLGFSATTDSFGNPWPQELERAYEPSTDLLSIIQDLHDSGLVNWWFQGFTLHMSLPGEWDKRYNTDDIRAYIPDHIVESSPESERWTDQINGALLLGDDGFRFKQTWDDKLPYGNRTAVIDAGGITTPPAARAMLQQEYRTRNRPSRQYTREWVYTGDVANAAHEAGGTPNAPLRNFSVGDTIFLDTQEGRRQRVKVSELSIQRTTSGALKFFVTAGDIHHDPLANVAYQVKANTKSAKVARTGPSTKASGGIDRIESHPGENRGLKVSKEGLTNQTATGAKTFELDPQTGAATMSGVYRSSNYTTKPGPPYVYIDDTKASNSGIRHNNHVTQIMFVTTPGGETSAVSPRLLAEQPGSDGRGSGSVRLASGVVGKRYSLVAPTATGLRLAFVKDTNNTYPYPASGDDGILDGAEVRVESASVGDRVVLRSAMDGRNPVVGELTVSPGAVLINGTIIIPKIDTTTSSTRAPLVITSSGIVAKQSSSGRDKLDREEVTLDEARAVLDLAPVTWRDRHEVDDDPDTEARYVGYVAEDVADVSDQHAGALDTIIVRDEDGAPAGIDYARLPDPYTLQIIKDLLARVEHLEAQLDALGDAADPVN